MNLLLSSGNDTDVTEYEVLAHGLNKTSNESSFASKKLTCGKENTTDALNCQIKNKRTNSFLHRMTVDKPSNF